MAILHIRTPNYFGTNFKMSSLIIFNGIRFIEYHSLVPYYIDLRNFMPTMTDQLHYAFVFLGD